MVSGKTPSGFEYELDKNTLDNMELVDALADASDDDPIAVSRVVKLMLGNDLRGKLYDHCRDTSGRVPIAKVSEEVADIIKAFGQTGKN